MCAALNVKNKKPASEPASEPASTPADASVDDGYIPLKIRFMAWWEGVDAATLMRREHKLKGKGANAIKVDREAGDTSDKTDFAVALSIREAVWGENFAIPGGAEYVCDLLKPAGLKPGVTILDIAAGLGGAGRAIATTLEVYVEGLEANEELAEAGASRAAASKMKAQASVSVYKPYNPSFGVGRYDCVYAQEFLYRVLDKHNLIAEVQKTLRENGFFIFTDLVYADEESENTAEVKEWREAETELPDPWTKAKYESALTDLGFKIRVFEDRTDEYSAIVRKGWSNFANTLDNREVDRRYVDVMMNEAKIWLLRVKAMESGHLRSIRVIAHRTVEIGFT